MPFANIPRPLDRAESREHRYLMYLHGTCRRFDQVDLVDIKDRVHVDHVAFTSFARIAGQVAL